MSHRMPKLIASVYYATGFSICHFYKDCPKLLAHVNNDPKLIQHDNWYEGDYHENWSQCPNCIVRRNEEENANKRSKETPNVSKTENDDPAALYWQHRNYALGRLRKNTALGVLGLSLYVFALIYTFFIAPKSGQWHVVSLLFSDKKSNTGIYFFLSFMWAVSRSYLYEDFVDCDYADVCLPVNYLKKFEYLYTFDNCKSCFLYPHSAKIHAEGKPVIIIKRTDAIANGLIVNETDIRYEERSYCASLKKKRINNHFLRMIILILALWAAFLFFNIDAARFIASNLPD